jgi:hypothetical protein
MRVKRTEKYPWYPVLKGQRRRAALIVDPKEQFPQFRNFYYLYGRNPETDNITTEISYIQTHMERFSGDTKSVFEKTWRRAQRTNRLMARLIFDEDFFWSYRRLGNDRGAHRAY